MGELARKPGAPTFADSPMELLTRPGRGFSQFQIYCAPVLWAFAGALAPMLLNNVLKRPMLSGIYVPILLGGAGYYFGSLFRDWRFRVFAEKDEFLKHYISLHPEDFPPYERQRFKDIFVPWHPVR